MKFWFRRVSTDSIRLDVEPIVVQHRVSARHGDRAAIITPRAITADDARRWGVEVRVHLLMSGVMPINQTKSPGLVTSLALLSRRHPGERPRR